MFYQILFTMKRAISTTLILIFVLTGLMAQNQIDRLFQKYQGKEGFVSFMVSGNMLRLVAALDEEGSDSFMKHASKFTSIRILAKENNFVESENFYDSVIDELMRGGYEEMMTVKSTGADLKMLLLTDGDIFREFILIVGGEENAIIQIKGNLSYDDIHEISRSVSNGQGMQSLNMFH